MPLPLPTMYPEDLSGLKASNLVPDEIHRPTGINNRVIVPEHGPFFTESVVVVDLGTGREMAPHTQWIAAQLEQDLTADAGKEIMSILVVTDTKAIGPFQTTYQTVGGPYSYSVKAIIEMVQQLDLDNRPIYWADILGKPDRYVPAPHPHHINDIGGWPVLFPALKGIEEAILLTDQAVLDAIRKGFRAEIVRIDSVLEQQRAQIFNHLNDFNNPHRLHIHDIDGLTAAEINLILTRYLPIDGRAVNSLRLNGLDQNQYRAWMVGTIQNTELTRGLMPRAALGTGYTAGMENPVLVGTVWKSAKDLIRDYGSGGSYYAGNTTAAAIAVTYSDITRYPIGTLVSWFNNRTYSVGTGNGSKTVRDHIRYLSQKYTASRWMIVSQGVYSGHM